MSNFDKYFNKQIKNTEFKKEYDELEKEFSSIKASLNNSIKQRILINKIKCNKCGDVIESTHRHDFKYCKCGNVAVDGGKDYLRRCANSLDDFNDLNQYEEMENKS